MKKKGLIVVLCIVSIIVLLFVGCSSNSGSTSTSNSNTEAKTHTHSWSTYTQSDTATCTEDGVATYKCYGCDEIKTEVSKAKGHSYNSTTEKCWRCGKWKYNISMLNDLPYDYNILYSGYNYTTLEVQEVSFDTYDTYKGNVLRVAVKGKKTYDSGGANATNTIGCNIKIVSTDGDVIGIYKLRKYSGVIVGQTITISDYSFDILTSMLDSEKSYVATFVYD